MRKYRMKTFEFGELVELRKEKYNPLTNDTVPCIELEHINQNSGTINGYVNSIEQKSIKNVFHKGDILFAKLRPYLRKYWFAEFDGVCSSEIWVLKPKSVVTAEYLFCLIQTEEFIRIANVSFGSKMPRADWDFINHYPFTIIHSLPEQHRIVSVLSLWDTAIEKQTALIEQLTLRKRGLMQQLLTGKKRLKGFVGEWKRIKAGEIFKSISVKGNGSEVLLSATQEHGVIPRDQLEGRVTMPTGDTNSFKLVEVGDFVISLRSFQGGLEYSEHRGIVSPAYTVLKPIVEIDKTFYRYYFKSAEFIGHLAIAVIGIRDGKQISYEDFCFVRIPYPNIKEQKAISSVLLQADKEIEIHKQKLAAMQAQKKGLMQVLLTGKKRIVNHKNNNYDG